MKDRLEDFIRENRLEFDSIEPSEELWEGIENKLDKGRKISWNYLSGRVAVVAAIFIISFMAQRFFMNSLDYNEIPEIVEAESYYSGLINTKLNEVKPMLVEFPEIEQELNADLSELDSVYTSLKDDLKDNIANQEVIEAMIENYRLRIEILEEMMHFLNKDDEKHTNKNNTSEYEL